MKDRDKDELSLRIDLTDNLDRSKEEYLNRYEGVTSEIINTTRFNENIDLSTAYLGQIRMTQGNSLKIEERFLITEQGYTVGKLLDGMECQILLDTGASKLFISKSYYLHCKSLHSAINLLQKTQIQVGNGQYVCTFCNPDDSGYIWS